MVEFNVIAGLVGSLLSIGSYFQRTHRNMTAMAALGPIAFAVAFLELPDLTTSALCVLASLRILLGVYVIKLPTFKRYNWTLLICVLICVVASITWQSPVSLVPVTASIIMTYAGYNLEYPKLRYGLLLGELVWCLNALLLAQYIWLVSCTICVGVNIIMMYKERHIKIQTS